MSESEKGELSSLPHNTKLGESTQMTATYLKVARNMMFAYW